MIPLTHAIRYIASGLLAAIVTMAAFFLMQKLISETAGERESPESPPGIRFVNIDIEAEIQRRQRRKPEPPPPSQPPPSHPDLQIAEVQQQRLQIPRLDLPKFNSGLASGPPVLGTLGFDRSAEGEVIPLARFQPQYPREALMSATEGYVIVEFTITETGAVRNPRVVESRPPRLFDREALRAIMRWKFKPRVVDGVAIERRARQKLEFNLPD